MQADFDKDLLTYFTDVEHLREIFKNLVAAPTLTKCLLVIHGVGGVGKSSLLRIFRLHCKSVNVPVALASGDEANSAPDVLTRWMEDLKVDGVAFPSFGKTFKHYRAIQAKVDKQAKKVQDARSRAADIAGKAASKTGEAAGGALIGVAIGSVIPGIGTAIGGALGGVLGGMGAEALTDWLRGFLTKLDIDLLLDPAKKLTDDFLADVVQIANKRRIVLMLDTFEQMTALDDWTRDVVQRVNSNSLLVIAGRALPTWNRSWSDWMANAQVEELKPMTEEVMRDLIRRYYATVRGGEPNPAQVEAIIGFARGLPMVVTSAVQLWVKYGVEDFQSVKAEIVANLVDRLMEGVPSALIPALEAAAIVRWFDQPILRAVTGLADVRESYNELRRFPFVRVRVEGLALHDAVREIIDENLRVQDSERHHELHERAAAYFEKRLEKATGEEAERLGLERLYHRVRADEKAGIKLFQEMAEELVRYRLVNRLRALLNDANTYPLERENSQLWREYYNARLIHMDGHWADAEKVYKVIGENEPAERKLRAYALCDLGQIGVRNVRLSESGGIKRALEILERSQELFPHGDAKFVSVFLHFQYVYAFQCQWDQAIKYVEMQRQFYRENADEHGMVYALNLLKDIYTIAGNWKEAYESTEQGFHTLKMMPESPFLKLRLTGDRPWNLLGIGRYADTEKQIRDGSRYIQQIGDENSLPSILRNLGLVLGLQGKYAEATGYFDESIEKYGRRGDYGIVGTGIVFGFWGATLAWQGELDKAQEYLNQSLTLKEQSKDSIGISQILNRLAELHEVRAKQSTSEAITAESVIAESNYKQSLDYRWTGRHHYESAALAGLVRVKHAQGNYADIPPLLAEAEQLAQQYEYNDHLASLRLTQGHLGQISNLSYYQQAMIYALRYNRFLLDEVLSGRPQGTPLRPIIPYCLERGEEGQRMLIALRDWWQTGVNDIGTPRPDTISPIPEGIALLEAERIAREREPGGGSSQKSVVEQIEMVLKEMKAG